MTYDHDEDAVADPLIEEADVIGLYPQSRAAAASKWTTTLDAEGTDD